MAKKDNNDVLDKDSSRRLEKFKKDWDQSTAGFMLAALTLPDLKLLLEHFAPLQELIRALVAAPAGTAPTALVDETNALRAQISDTEDRLSNAEDQLRQAQDSIAQALAELAEANTKCSALQDDLKQCNASAKTLLQQNKQHEQASKQLQKDWQAADKKLQASQAELARAGSAAPELALLRQDTALAQALSLSPLPAGDTEALIHIVAVLAQRDNLERLWSALKERCEAERRPTSAAEQALLSAALAWYNYNWRTRPYRLIDAAPAAAYDFNAHLRSRHTNTGEAITAQLLPGIADGSGNPLCKALVSTR